MAIAVVLTLLAGAGAAAGYAAWAMSGFEGGEPVTLTIKEGASAAEVGRALEQEDVIRSALAFQVRARMLELDRQMSAGEYELERGMSVDEAIETILEGPLPEDVIRFTIREGLTVEETLTSLAEQTDHSEDDYRQVLDDRELQLPEWVPSLDELSSTDGVREPYEGLLAPDTFEVVEDATPTQILQRMVDLTAERMEEVEDNREQGGPFAEYDRYEMLVLSSLIEREVQQPEELRTVSGVLKNRLDEEERLQIDASLLYAVNERGQRVQGEIRQVDSPYNTYERDGLPPTPIGGPGMRAIQAAYDPEEHDFRFYVKRDEEGNHAFAETFEEHQRNVDEFRELQQQAEQQQNGGEPQALVGLRGR